MADHGNSRASPWQAMFTSGIRDRDTARVDRALRWMNGTQTFGDVADYVAYLTLVEDPRASRAAARYVTHLTLALSADLAELRRILELVERLPDPAAARQLRDVASDANVALGRMRRAQRQANQPPPRPKRSSGDWE